MASKKTKKKPAKIKVGKIEQPTRETAPDEQKQVKGGGYGLGGRSIKVNKDDEGYGIGGAPVK